MKKIFLILSLTLPLMCITQESVFSQKANDSKIEYYDTKILDKGLKDFESKLKSVPGIDYIKESTEVDNKPNAMPFPSKEELVKFFYYMDFAKKSNFEWTVCFVDKKNNKLININDGNSPITETTTHITINRTKFNDLLKSSGVDIRLRKNNKPVTQNKAIYESDCNSESNNTNSNENTPHCEDDFYFYDFGDELMPTDVFFHKQFYDSGFSSSILGGVSSHEVTIIWYKKTAYEGYFLLDPRPDVDNFVSTINPQVGEYTEGGCNSSFSPFNTQLISGTLSGYVSGTVKLTAAAFNFQVGYSEIVVTNFTIIVN